jgi:hypothetical protein
MDARAKLALLSLAGALTLTTPAGAGSVTFGPDIDNLPANDTPNTTCAHTPSGYSGSPPASCMWSMFDSSSRNTLGAPASGTVTRIRVKVGQTTGPMRVAVIRFLFQQTGDPSHPTSAGPFLEAYGPQFTPAAGAITPVGTSLPMREDPTPPYYDTQTIQVIDVLALEVLSTTVPIPLYSAPGVLTYPIYPGPTSSGTPAPSSNALPSYTNTGVGVLMNADLQTASSPGGPAPTPLPAIGLRSTTVPVARNVAALPIRCSGADCAGAIQLLKLAGAAATKPKNVSYGSARFKVKAGRAATVKITLNRAGRALLKHHRTAKVYARTTFSSGGGKTRSVRVTLKR